MDLYSTLDCAKALGLKEHRITYAHRTGRLREPQHVVAGKRIYTIDDVRVVATYFGVDWPQGDRDDE